MTMGSMSGIWLSSLQRRIIFSHPRRTRLSRVIRPSGSTRHCSNSSKCTVSSGAHWSERNNKQQEFPVANLHSSIKDTDYTQLYHENEKPVFKCQNAPNNFISQVVQDSFPKFSTPLSQFLNLGKIPKNERLMPRSYSKHLKKTLLLCKAPSIFSARFARNFSNQPEEPEHHDQVKKDPELKAWLQEISRDFKSEQKVAVENAGEESTTGSESGSSSSDSSFSDSSYSDSESSSSDSESSSSDSDSSSSESSDSESNEKTMNSPDSAGPRSQLHTNPLDSLTKMDLASAALSDTNVDGSVLEEEEFDDEEEYEDFYHDFEDEEEEMPQRHLPISLERGTLGVYDITELVTLLVDENARDICVMSVPSDYKYVDYMVVVTGRSTRHLKAMAELVRWVYKQKRSQGDPKTVKIEGEETKDWMALDLGNIAVHMFLEDTRAKYDLETLWTVGSDFDSKSQDEELDPFALFVDQAWAGFHVEPEPQPKATPLTNNQSSMDSLAGWHGGSNSTTR